MITYFLLCTQSRRSLSVAQDTFAYTLLKIDTALVCLVEVDGWGKFNIFNAEQWWCTLPGQWRRVNYHAACSFRFTEPVPMCYCLYSKDLHKGLYSPPQWRNKCFTGSWSMLNVHFIARITSFKQLHIISIISILEMFWISQCRTIYIRLIICVLLLHVCRKRTVPDGQHLLCEFNDASAFHRERMLCSAPAAALSPNSPNTALTQPWEKLRQLTVPLYAWWH